MLTVRFAVLGPVEAENEHGPINLRGHRHRAVLARLLIARGQVVPVRRLVDDLWIDPPEGALGAVQTFVGTLRKALEPDRAPRTPARLLVTAPPGYLLRTSAAAVDAWRFEDGVTGSARLLADNRATQARHQLDEILTLWRGAAYAEFAEYDWARGESTRLEELRLIAVRRRAEAALAVGDSAAAAADLELLVVSHPHREDGWRLLALALYRSGRQGEALAVLRRAREVLRDDLGVDPGTGLRELESDILAQATHLDAPQGALQQYQEVVRALAAVTEPADNGDTFVGRSAELSALLAAGAKAVALGRPRLALVSGMAGAGKTALAGRLVEQLNLAGWTTATGASPEIPGAPTAWPWTQLQNDLHAAGHQPASINVEADPDEPAAARFRRIRAMTAYLGGIAEQHPVVLVFDDLQWADEETLALLTAVVADQRAGPVLVVGTYRSTEIGEGLGGALGRLARQEPVRIYLAGLTASDVRDLFTAITSQDITGSDAETIHTRTAGNPFFVRELAGLWVSDGRAALQTVPAGVRDVIRHRVSGLPVVARTHLRQAAVIGLQVDLDVLIALAENEEAVLASVELAELSGFLIEEEDNRLRFAHALVQEAVYEDITGGWRTRWHAAVADSIALTHPADVEAIAHHLLRAGSRSSADRTAHYARLAAQRAENRFAPQQAAQWWAGAIAALDRMPIPDARIRLDMAMGLVRALALGGHLQQARAHRADAVTAAEALGDPLLTARVIGAFDVPAIWTTNDDEALSARLVEAAERTLTALPDSRLVERAQLLATIAIERRADPGPRGEQAALEAERIARDLADPNLLVLALNGRFLQTFHRAGLAPARARIGEELLGVAMLKPGLVAFEVLGHLILIQAGVALADLPAADRHAAAVDRLADRFDLPVAGVFTDWYAALRLTVAGDLQSARSAYRQAAGRLTGTGMTGIETGILPLALLCMSAPDAPPATEHADWGPYENWARPLVLLAQGHRALAAEAVRSTPTSPRDLLFELRSCLHAMAAVEVGDRAVLERLHADLLPAADELAGAASGLVTLGPTAQILGHLSTALGRDRQAADHYRQALAVAERCGAPHWARTARDRLRRNPND